MSFWDNLNLNMQLDHQRKMQLLQQIGVVLQLARNKYDFGEFSSALSVYEQALAMAQMSGAAELVRTILWEMGDTCRKTEQSDKALQFYNTALRMAKKNGDKARLLNNIALVYHDDFGNTQQALEYYQKALSVYLGFKERGLKRTILSNAGLACEELGNYQQARTYFNESLELAQKLNDRKSQDKIRGFLERLPK